MSEENWGFFSTGPPESLRDAGYKNSAYALGELVDNSIEEDAEDVDIIMFERLETSGSQRRWKINEIGILDNGNGMDPFQLRCSLRYQDGANQRRTSRSKTGGKKMGKFGVGLPQATLSQCRRVDIWSWDSGGPESAMWTYFDLDEPETFRSIPEPVKKEIPKKWKETSRIWFTSGTLIVWSKLDRLRWSTSTGLYRNSEFLIGRMYRKHIRNRIALIKMRAFEDKPPYRLRYTDRDKNDRIDDDEYHDWELRPNDPLYLDPDAFAANPPVSPAFLQAGETQTWKYDVQDEQTGEVSEREVSFTLSIAKTETREGHNFDPKRDRQGKRGGQPHGRHAFKNMGLSIVREDRELELDSTWSQGRNVAYERWWGAEVCFDKGMDHIFDVTNNKQHAQRLNEVSKRDWDYFREDDLETEKEIRDRLKVEDYPTWVCLDVKERITKQIELVRTQLQKSSVVKKSSRKRGHKLAEQIATEKLAEDRQRGVKGKSDSTIIVDKEEKREALRKQLKDEGLDQALVDHLDELLITSGFSVAFAEKPIDGDAFFSVEAKVGSLIVFLNENHGAFKHLFSVIDKIDTEEEISNEELRKQVIHASAALKVMLAAWARYEDAAQGPELKSIQRIRRDWGRYADDWLPTNDDQYLED